MVKLAQANKFASKWQGRIFVDISNHRIAILRKKAFQHIFSVLEPSLLRGCAFGLEIHIPTTWITTNKTYLARDMLIVRRFIFILDVWTHISQGSPQTNEHGIKGS